MAVTLKLLASGTLTTTLTTTLATVPTGQTWRIYSLRLASAGAASAFTFSINHSSVEKKIADAMSISANSAYEMVDIILEAGDILKGGATTPVDYTLFGVVST